MGKKLSSSDLTRLLKRVVELVTPDLRSYYRMPVKARVVKSYASDGQYWADVQILRNDESKNDSEPVIPKVEIPVIWGGPMRGVVCPIPKGTHVTVSFHDGDPDYPFISHVRWYGNKAPECEVNAFIIQSAADCHFKIDVEKNVLTITPKDVRTNAGGNMSIEVAGDVDLQVGGNVTATVGGDLTATVGGDMTAAAGGDIMASADGSVVVEAGGDATISAGGSVSISGTAIDLN